MYCNWRIYVIMLIIYNSMISRGCCVNMKLLCKFGSIEDIKTDEPIKQFEFKACEDDSIILSAIVALFFLILIVIHKKQVRK